MRKTGAEANLKPISHVRFTMAVLWSLHLSMTIVLKYQGNLKFEKLFYLSNHF